MDKHLSIRIPDTLSQRLDALVEDPPADLATHGRVTPSKVAREALARGLVELERQRKRQRKGRQG